MKRVVTAAALADLASADFNELQDRGAALVAASENNDFAAAVKGADAVIWQVAASSVAAATTRLLDKTIDWRDRYVWGHWIDLAANSRRIGASDQDHTIESLAKTDLYGYTGLGAERAGGGAVADGFPPVSTGASGAPASWRIRINGATDTIWLYVSKVDNGLYVYNGSAAAVFPLLVVHASADTGKR